jgi:hypothetical protein
MEDTFEPQIRTYVAHLEGTSPVSFSRHYEVPKQTGETHEEYERRTWRNRLHTNKKGFVVLPSTWFKYGLDDVAKRLGMKLKGAKTYASRFKTGIVITDGITLAIHRDKVEGVELFVPSDGIHGGSKRVMKIFPTVDEWEGDLKIHCYDGAITRDILLRHLQEMGIFAGIGQYRVAVGGTNGRFRVESLVEVPQTK